MTDSIEYLTAVAVVEAARAGFEYRVERSDRSEATYVKVLRVGVWYGVRIASHLPFYHSSADYRQILVPRTSRTVAELEAAESRLISEVRDGGRVIADPDEVDEALFAAWRRLRRGAEVETPPGVRWRWDDDRLRWVLAEVAGHPPTAAELAAFAAAAPPDPPRPVLAPREQSAVRHRLNTRAAWAHEEQQRLAVRA